MVEGEEKGCEEVMQCESDIKTVPNYDVGN